MNPVKEKSKILIIVFNGLKTDARVLKQIAALKNDYELTAISFQDPNVSGLQHITIGRPKPGIIRKMVMTPLLLTGFYKTAYWLLYNYKYLKDKISTEFDLIIANDIETVPLAYHLKNGAKVLFDAHEYAPRQFENNPKWKLLFKGFNTHLCKIFIPRVDKMITQNDLFAREYEKEFQVLPEVMTNAPDYIEIKPHPTIEKEIKIVHHGIYNQTRKLERLIEIADRLESRFRLYLMIHLPLTANEVTHQKFRNFQKLAQENSKIEWMDPVGGEEVVEAISAFDIGLHILEPINFNHKYSLPNKLLEFIQARLAVVIGPSPGMVGIVTKFETGVISEDFSNEKLIDSIQSLSVPEIDQFKANSESAAKDLNSEVNVRLLKNIVKDCLN